MERIALRSEIRTTHGKKVKNLRAANTIPAIVYGRNIASQSIQVEERVLVKALQEAGSTTLIDLFVGGASEPRIVLAREIRRDSLTGRMKHVDFYEVRLTEKVRTSPRIEFVGESPIVKSGAGVLLHAMTSVEIECLPTELIHSIEVDISALKTLGDNILVSSLSVPDAVTIMADPDDVVASVVPARTAALEEEAEPQGEAEEES